MFTHCSHSWAGDALGDLADERLDKMIQIADETGLSLDVLVRKIGRVDQITFDALTVNPSRLLRYIQSSDKP